MPSLSVIIVSFNTNKILKDCLSSLYKNTLLPLEVIVIDNASTDGSPAMVKKNFKKVKLIENKDNRGFGAANNQGAKLAKSDFLLFLNSDTLIHDDAISRSLDYALSRNQLGALSCRLNNADGSLQPSGGFFPSLLNLLTWQLGLDDLPLLNRLLEVVVKPIHPKASFYQRRPRQLDWITGAFMIIPRRVFTTIGGFDQKIFMYAEELELCYRIRKKALRIYYYPEATITHLGGQSAGAQLALLSEIKGIKYFFKKHRPHWQLPLVSFLFWLGSLLRLLAFAIIGKYDQARIYRQALSL